MINVLVQKNENVKILDNIRDVSLYIDKKGYCVWVDVQKPANEDMAFLESHFAFHPLAIEDCMASIQRPKIDLYENYLFIVLHAAIIAPHKDKATSLELDTFIGSNFIVTVHFKSIPSVTSTWDRCLKNASLMSRGPAYLFYYITDALVDNYFPILEKVDGEIESIEDTVFKNMEEAGANVLNKIFSLRENVLILRRIIIPQRETINSIARGKYHPIIPNNLSIYFRDISDLLARISDTLDTYRDTLTSALDGYMSSTTKKLNEIMKVLTIIATIMMPLTLITGIYGMNFKYMPELDMRYGYFGILGLMFFIAGIMLVYFKRKGWL